MGVKRLETLLKRPTSQFSDIYQRQYVSSRSYAYNLRDYDLFY